MEQKIVVHTKKGTIHKGVTHDFDPDGQAFHLLPGEGGGIPTRLNLEDLKAVFWVKDYFGNREFVPRRGFSAEDDERRRAILTFEDGEEVWGTVEGATDGSGFFLFPADRGDNNVRIFVVRSALKELRKVT